jgi:hypothetical protein
LPVENIDKISEEAGKPFLYVLVNIMDDASAAIAEGPLCQDAVLARSPQSWMPGLVTWETSLLVSHPTGKGLRSDVKDMVDRFLNAWLAANPVPR